ncbi:hypothetical protein QYF36_020841 [Acer negundo]|nr:hypothetical protein QYF36_020841 [Acer negundo]
MYLNSRKSVEANVILKDFSGFDLVVHNCMINANVQWGNLDQARKLFDEMPERNEVSWTTLISGFMKYGRVEESIRYFEKNPFQTVVSWTAAISGFVQNGFSFEALKLFLKLLESGVKPNEVTFTSIFRACAELGDFRLGMGFFGLIVKAGFENKVSVSNSLISLCLKMHEIDMAWRVFDLMKKKDVVSWTTILDMYVEMGDLVEARRIFDMMPERNEITWSVMIARYSQSGYHEEALKLFHQMVQEEFKPNTSCFSTVVSALTNFEALRPGMNLHAHVVKIGIVEDVFISSSLVDLYCKCGKTKDGRLMFDSIVGNNVVSWNSMIGGYSLNGEMEEAKMLFDIMPLRNDVSWSAIISGYLEYKQFDKVFEVFNEMLLSGEIPNKSTFSSLLCATAGMASLEKGKDLHGKVIKLGVEKQALMMDSYTLKSVQDLPVPFRSAFSFRYFNSLQSECFPVCFQSDVNMVISAPTGSGKTVLFELCILRLLSRFITEGRFVHIKGTLKTIYIAPSKALVQEKLRDWSQKFGSWGMNCLELTGDNEFYNTRNIQEADIILTTPEKFDAVTRYRIKDGGLSFFSDITLILVDEVHLLNDPRGAALEAIISRIKMLARKPEMKSSPLASVRFLAVSATIPNIEDLAEWLHVPAQGIKRFGEEMRPVKLTTKVFDILMQFARGRSALVFCSTRKGAQEAAQQLSQTAMTFGYSNPFIKDHEQQERLREASLSCSEKQMQSYILYGVGFHNGGLCMKDRSLIEGLFLKGDLQILCTTNTLAHGVNLPAHTVVIKSTQHFNKEKGLYMEYDRSTIHQVHLYENLLNGCEMVESQLLSCLTEHLTAEIVQLTVSDITRAIEWMKCSYLYNPQNYAVRKVISRDRIEKHMQEICVKKVNELSCNQMIWTDEDGFLLKPLEPGRLMTKYYLKFDTMKHIMLSPVNCSLEDALHVICHAEEISWIQLRRNEKKILNDINADKNGRLRFHINGDKGKRKKRIQTREEKIFVLANDCLTGDPSVHDLSLTQDMNSLCSNGCRIAKCMKEYFIYKKNYRGAVNSTLLAKSLYQRLWDDSPYLLKQLPGIGMVTAKALHSMGIKSFETLADGDPRRIEIVTGRKYPFGNHIKESLQSLPPKVDLKIEEVKCQRQGGSKLVVTLIRLSQSVQSTKHHYADMIVGAEEDNLILFHEKIRCWGLICLHSVIGSCLNQAYHQKRRLLGVMLSFYVISMVPSFFHHLTLSMLVAAESMSSPVGIDLHQKLLMVKESNSKLNHRRGSKQPSFFPPPEEVCVIEDENENGTSSHTTSRKLNSLNSRREDSSMPSFSLLDEELGEGIALFDACALPMISFFRFPHYVFYLESLYIGGPASEIDDDDDCKIITEQTIFEHIHEKAKRFPILAASKNVQLPSSESFFLKRKRPPEKFPELRDEDVLEETEVNNFPQVSLLSPFSESKELEPKEVDFNNYNFVDDDTGGVPCLHEENTSKTLTGETIFDHIRKKSKNFPALNFNNIFKNVEAEPLLHTNKHSSASDILEDTNPYEILRDSHSQINPKLDSGDAIGTKRSSCATYGKVSNANAELSSTKMLSYDISMIKNSTWFGEPGSSMEVSRKQKCSPSGSGRQCSSPLTITGKTGEVDSFLGFKSVFSFL